MSNTFPINLREAHLHNTDLQGTLLDGTDFRGAGGIVAVQFAGHSMYIQKEVARIGLFSRTISDWLALTVRDAVVSGLPHQHLDFYQHVLLAAEALLRGE